MEELNLMELVMYYLKKAPIILLTVSAAIVLGVIYITKIQVPMYHGTTSIILVQKQENDSATLTQSELQINEKLVSTYSEIIKSRRVLSQVIDELNLDYSIKDLAEKISVTSLSNTQIIKVVVDDKDANMAKDIANTTAKVFSKEVVDIYNLENISILDEAIKEANAYNVNIPKQIIIYTIAGFILGCAIVFIMYYFSDTIKNKKEIETKLKLPVLGEVPLATKANIEDHVKTNKQAIFEQVDKTYETKAKKAPVIEEEIENLGGSEL